MCHSNSICDALHLYTSEMRTTCATVRFHQVHDIPFLLLFPLYSCGKCQNNIITMNSFVTMMPPQRCMSRSIVCLYFCHFAFKSILRSKNGGMWIFVRGDGFPSLSCHAVPCHAVPCHAFHITIRVYYHRIIVTVIVVKEKTTDSAIQMQKKQIARISLYFFSV